MAEKDKQESRKRLKKQRKEMMEDRKRIEEEIASFKLKEVEGIADKIAELFPGGISDSIRGSILAILLEFQKKNEEPFNKLLEMERVRRIMELQDTGISDPDWWAKASEAKFLGIEIPGMEDFSKGKKIIKKSK